MIIGDRLRAVREEKELSQGDIEKRSGLLHCYILRVENGHQFRPLRRLKKSPEPWRVPLYQLFYDGQQPPEVPNLPNRKTATEIAWGSSGKDARL